MPIRPGYTKEFVLSQAIDYRKVLWGKPEWLRVKEDARISALNSFCTKLMCGDKDEGIALAREALYRESAS